MQLIIKSSGGTYSVTHGRKTISSGLRSELMAMAWVAQSHPKAEVAVIHPTRGKIQLGALGQKR